ncbi:MAG: DUF4838 domain-containing protein [Verrucomicrobiae bacterium]|nr:DUF4838 domain-containing protein [Verrucomicrobiae bacterium]
MIKQISVIAILLVGVGLLNGQGSQPGSDAAMEWVQKESPGRCQVKLGGKALGPDSHAIMISEDESLTERYAAKELQTYLELVTGCRLPILRDSEAVADRRSFLVVGKSRLLDEWKINVDWKRLGKEGIFIKTHGPHLILAGGQRGALYACYTFLEDYLGVHWLSTDCTVFPRMGMFDLGGIDKIHVPPLESREPFSFIGKDGHWAACNKANGSMAGLSRLSDEQGGMIVYPKDRFVHTFYRLVPPERYFNEHPEYFAENNGKRHHGKSHAQLCLSNPEVEKIVVEEAKRWIRETPGVSIVSISQNDGGPGCECAKCKAIDDDEGGAAGSLLRFVNRVAGRIEDEHPRVAIETLAYTYTRKPPKITKPRPNVIVRLCSIECSFAQPLETGGQNRGFREEVENWGGICRKLYVWDYVTNFRHYQMPFPNLRVLKPNIQFFIKNGVKGIFEQGCSETAGGEFMELRSWLLAKFLWNPDEDFNKLLQTFLEGYYGGAAAFIRQYIDLIHDSVEKTNTYLGVYDPPEKAAFLTPEVVARAEELFNRAEEAVANEPVLLKRVQTARLPLLYFHLASVPMFYHEEGETLVSNAKPGYGGMLEKFERFARAVKVTNTAEGPMNVDAWLGERRAIGAKFSLKRIQNAVLSLDVLPGFGGRIWRMKYLPSSKMVIRPEGTPDKRPIGYGYEEYCNARYHSPGWCEKYEVREISGRHLVLETFLREQGLRLTRRFELDETRPILNITSTLVNQTQSVCPVSLRIHPEFAIRDIQKTTVKIKRKNGSRRELPMSGIVDRAKDIKDVWLGGEDLPHGEWSFVDATDGLEMINRFNPAKVRLCYVLGVASSRIVLEMYAPKVELKPGENWEFKQSYEMVPQTAGNDR